jgi:ElaB/YqjD/DUF883 family membrane-anchored ribosome-binding protein
MSGDIHDKTRGAQTEGASSAAADVTTDLTALRADIAGLADSVKRVAAEAPDLARENLEASVRRNPLQAVAIAAGIGFVVALLTR